MTASRYPHDTLPGVSLWSFTPEPNALQSDEEYAHTERRKSGRQEIRIGDAAWTFLEGENSVFQAWYDTDLNKGIKRFYIKLPAEHESGFLWHVARFLRKRVVTKGFGYHEVVATLEAYSIPGEPPENAVLSASRLLLQQSRLLVTPPSNAKGYNAWPVATRLANGDILVGYSSTVGHHTSNDSNGVIKRSTDNGATWGSEIVVYNDASKGVYLYGLGQSGTGRVFATLWMDNVSSPTDSGEALIAYSDDNGATWSAPVNITSVSGITKTVYSSGPVISAPNGDLLCTVEGVDTGQSFPTDDRTVMLRSTDNGATWGSPVTVASPALYPGRFYAEPFLHRIGARVYCYMRTGVNSGDVYRSYSDDSGVTWSAPALMFEGVSVPNVVRMQSGLLVAVMRQEAISEGRGVLYASADNGTTWVRSFLDDPGYEMVYGAPVDRLDGTVLCVYTNEVSSGANSSVVASVAVPMPSAYAPWGAMGANISILDNLTARCLSGGGAARGAVGFSGASRKMVEMTVVEGDLVQLLGVMQSTASLSVFPGAGTGGVALYLNDGEKYVNGVNSAYSTAGAVGVCYGIEWVGDGSVRIHRNGVDLGAIVTGLTGEWFPAWGPGSVSAVKRGVNLNTAGPFCFQIAGASPLT